MRLAAAALTAGQNDLIHTIPSGCRAILTLTVCNRAAATAKIRVALTNGAAPVVADWIEYDTPLPAAGSAGGSSLQLTGIALGAGQRLYVRSDIADVSATVCGVQELI